MNRLFKILLLLLAILIFGLLFISVIGCAASADEYTLYLPIIQSTEMYRIWLPIIGG